MPRAKVEEIYQRHIKLLTFTERKRLLEILTQDLAAEAHSNGSTEHSIMELHGLGKEIWEGIDAQDYVKQLRNEWERPGEA